MDRVDLQGLGAALAAAGWRVFHVDGRRVVDKAGFLAACADAMEFPDYFGGNWDALDECLHDLSWAPARGYLIVLEGMEPFAAAAPADWHVATEVLADAARHWRQQGRGFYVVQRLA